MVEDKIRCVCGCYMQVDYGTDENSNEYYEAYCSRCKKEWSGTL